MGRENVEIVRRAVEAAAQRPPDWETLNALYHPAHEFIPLLAAVEGGRYVGSDGFRAWLAQMDEWGDWVPEVGEIRAGQDGRLVVLSRVRTRARQSGVPLDRDVGSVVTVRDGRIVRTEIFGTHDEALEAVGLGE